MTECICLHCDNAWCEETGEMGCEYGLDPEWNVEYECWDCPKFRDVELAEWERMNDRLDR